MTKKVILGVLIVVLAGLVYWRFVGPVHARWERKLNARWFSPEYAEINERKDYIDMVDRFKVEKDLTVNVYLNEDFKKIEKNPDSFFKVIYTFVDSQTAHPNTVVLFYYGGSLVLSY